MQTDTGVDMVINGVRSTDSAGSVAAVTPAGSDRTSRASSVPPPPNAAASAEISKPGELFSKLQQLLQKDPEKFKEVVGEVAHSLRDAAQKATGRGAEFLNRLADRLDQTAQTGDLSALAPKESRSGGEARAHHHHGHHGGAVGSALENALDQVNQALGAVTAPPTTPVVVPTAATAPAAPTVPAPAAGPTET
jgi:hypothetical protein